MAVLKLIPSCKDYLWGGNRLRYEYGKKSDADKIAETWELSCHSAGASFIEGSVGVDGSPETLRHYIERQGKAVLGSNCQRFEDFPILIKFIDARDNLSIQVHPDNEYALKCQLPIP